MAMINQDSRLAQITGEGLVLVATDLHGNCDDFASLRSIFTRLWMRSRAHSRPVLVITGDLFHGPKEGADQWLTEGVSSYLDQSARLFHELMVLVRAYPDNIVVLLGNHDHSHVGGPTTAKFHQDEAAFFESSLSNAEITRLRTFLQGLPVVAVTDANVVFTHAAAPAMAVSRDDLSRLRVSGFEHLYPIEFMGSYVLGQLLWRRQAPVSDTLRFIRAITGHASGIHIHGHNVAPKGFIWESAHELCVSSSFGAEDLHKTVVLLENGRSYNERNVAVQRGIIHRLSDLGGAA